jgi:hypothetical protein
MFSLSILSKGRAYRVQCDTGHWSWAVRVIDSGATAKKCGASPPSGGVRA